MMQSQRYTAPVRQARFDDGGGDEDMGVYGQVEDLVTPATCRQRADDECSCEGEKLRMCRLDYGQRALMEAVCEHLTKVVEV